MLECYFEGGLLQVLGVPQDGSHDMPEISMRNNIFPTSSYLHGMHPSVGLGAIGHIWAVVWVV